ncbi:DUF3185 family protein [Cohnella luojiensis]|uniref:DUF3185 family protein n=1 Tax=Cohnella luojiensis TaxID=652876 RepID=A0A4Y8M0R9_9BACL|nr:DUF3185 family protein [Cohnella luojiensis]TFE27523.1 DUF3185 family protein [Cohnella luojiensis]
MSQPTTSKPTNPLLISVIGLILIVFGIVDLITVDKLLGTILLTIGIVLGISGIQRYKALKAQLLRNKQQ